MANLVHKHSLTAVNIPSDRPDLERQAHSLVKARPGSGRELVYAHPSQSRGTKKSESSNRNTEEKPEDFLGPNVSHSWFRACTISILDEKALTFTFKKEAYGEGEFGCTPRTHKIRIHFPNWFLVRIIYSPFPAT